MNIYGTIVVTLGQLYSLTYSGSAFYFEHEHWYGLWWEDKGIMIPKTALDFSITLDGAYLTPEPAPKTTSKTAPKTAPEP